MPRITEDDIRAAERLLGVRRPDLRSCRDHREAMDRVKRWQHEVVHAAWKAEVRRVHPDHGVDDHDRERRTRATARLNAARDVLTTIAPVARPTHQPAIRVVIINVGGNVTASATGSNTYTTPW